MNQSKLVLGLSSLLLSISLSGLAAAQNSNADAVVTEHPLIAGFSDATIVDMEINSDVNYRIVLGSLQRIRGQVVPEGSERLRGDVTKITYEISPEFNGEDVFAFYQEQMQERNYTELFTCQGRACGSSNYWANDIFRNRELYGPERNQFYLAMRTNNGAEVDDHIALYVITRGNRRVYAHLEIVEISGASVSVPEPPASGLLLTLQEQGSATLGVQGFDETDQLIEGSNFAELIQMLNQDASIRIYVVAHLSIEAPLNVLMQRSLLRANAVKQALVGSGIDETRISAQGLGPLAPSCARGNCGDRIELVLQ